MEGTLVRRLIDRYVPLAVSLPGAVVGVGTALMMIAAPVTGLPWWRVEQVNFSEAAALRDRATVVQMLADGEDPYLRREIRADLVFNNRVELSPVEAGVATHRAEIVDIILFSAKTLPDAAAWDHLRCLALLEEDEDVIEVLNRYRPAPVTPPACDDVKRTWR
jgi:hypothetical protein